MLLANEVIKAFGGATQLADSIGRDRTAVWRWTQPKEKGGTGGYIPTQAINLVLEAAEANGIRLQAQGLLEEDEQA